MLGRDDGFDDNVIDVCLQGIDTYITVELCEAVPVGLQGPFVEQLGGIRCIENRALLVQTIVGEMHEHVFQVASLRWLVLNCCESHHSSSIPHNPERINA